MENRTTYKESAIHAMGLMHRFIRVWAVLVYLLFLTSTSPSKAATPQARPEVVVEYSATLSRLGDRLVEVIAIRLARYDVQAIGQITTGDEAADLPAPNGWTVQISDVGSKNLIIQIDAKDPDTEVSEIRSLERNGDTESLAWTIGLIVEETVAPYMDSQFDLAALGVGLAVLEPSVVAGTKKEQRIAPIRYPFIQSVGLSLSLTGVWPYDQTMVGPDVILKGKFSPVTTAAISMGWSARTAYHTHQIDGTVSQVPIHVLMGYLFVQERHFELTGWGGMHLGFFIYKNDYLSMAHRTDLTFCPGGVVFLEIVALFKKPWALFIKTGAIFPFVRDLLENHGVEVYNTPWILPVFSMGLELRF